MTTTAKPDSQRRNIQVYFLAAPEDQAVCEDIIKHLKPITRSSPVPIAVNSDFNIPGGAEIEKHKARLLEADIVLALISVDFIDNDDIYNRNQKVIERYNKRETVMIPILVRNFMWKATPFSSLPVLPKNLQPLNNKQFWNSHDDALMAVVHDIYESINGLAERQRAVLEPFAAAAVAGTPDLQNVAGPSIPQPEPPKPMTELPPTPSEIVQPSMVAEVESPPAPAPVRETIVSQPEPSSPLTELPQMSGPEVESAPDLKATSGTVISEATSQARASVPIAVDWRKKYYTTVLIKRAGAILLDHIIVYIAAVIILLPLAFINDSDDFLISAANWVFLILYFGIMPMMESSKRQATIGKRLLRLQITDREGERITFLRAVWRNIMRTVVLYSYIMSVGVLLIIQYLRFNKTRKLFHDELSGTVIGDRLVASTAAQVAMHPA